MRRAKLGDTIEERLSPTFEPRPIRLDCQREELARTRYRTLETQEEVDAFNAELERWEHAGFKGTA